MGQSVSLSFFSSELQWTARRISALVKSIDRRLVCCAVQRADSEPSVLLGGKRMGIDIGRME